LADFGGMAGEKITDLTASPEREKKNIIERKR